jgi:hypothetical protein
LHAQGSDVLSATPGSIGGVWMLREERSGAGAQGMFRDLVTDRVQLVTLDKAVFLTTDR